MREMREMNDAKIEQLIINSAYREPEFFWKYDDEPGKFVKVIGRRPSGFVVKKSAKDEGTFIEIELVNKLRTQVSAWREKGYTGITGTTRTLLEHWHNDSVRYFPFFWCQLDAIETLIFLTEAHEIFRAGLEIPNDGGHFRRLCTKLCTGGGKTIVMSMLIAWQVCNKVNYPTDKRFTKNILVITPNLTVKSRLQVLRNDRSPNYYEQFSIVPPELQDRLTQGRIVIHNWQALEFETQEDIDKKKIVDKRKPKSENAYANGIVGNMKNILVINDEAHHAYRLKPEEIKRKASKEEKASQREATVWISGLDKIDIARRITTCYDFSATPYVPGKNTADEDSLFRWIVSDFSLNDGIESGLVKTPRFVVRDNTVPDAATYWSRLSHIYGDDSVKSDLNRAAQSNEELPDLVRNAYMLLGRDWRAVYEYWQSCGKNIPPVMITVANRTETAARIEYAFMNRNIDAPGLDEHILRIDSKKLDEPNSNADELREIADSVGREGMKGEQIRNVISVGMLSEGWDARNVTHIMGLRAFTSQLLCEQVIGRGLRRTSYDTPQNPEGLFSPEYVNVFGIPFEFLPHEDTKGKAVPDRKTTLIKVLPEREELRISWPNIQRIEYVMTQTLRLDVEDIPELELDAGNTSLSAELVPVLDGKADLTKCSTIELDEIYGQIRLQRMIFSAAGKIYDRTATQWQKEGVTLMQLAQVIHLTEEYLRNGRIKIMPEIFGNNSVRRNIVYALNMERIINYLWKYITSENTERLLPVLDPMKNVCSTGDMSSWYTSRPSHETTKSHINRCVYDSTWEASTEYFLESSNQVKAWAKNDHLGFYVSYMHKGTVKRYIPDFLIRLANDKTLILEVKGIESEQDKAKREALSDWVRVVNDMQTYGEWVCDVVSSPSNVESIIIKYL